MKIVHKKKIYLYIVSSIIAIIAVLILLDKANVIHLFQAASKPTSADNYTKGETRNKSKSGNTETGINNPSGSSSQQNNYSSSAVSLVSPSGDFVSDHHPNLGGSPAPNSMTSVCSTNPGASCYITFTNTQDGVTKSLSAQTTDSGGATYWSWTLQSIGLTAGSWKIQAFASLDNQIKTSTDAMELVVSQ